MRTDLTLVVCETYLHPDLDALNQNYRRQGRRWLLIKPHGRELWLGPLFDPEQPGCWACLQRLLARHRHVERFAAAVEKSSLDRLVKPMQVPGGAVWHLIGRRLRWHESLRMLRRRPSTKL